METLEKDGDVELRGNLKDFSLPDIIQLVAFGRKTGSLRVTHRDTEAALFFDDGNVVHAEFPGSRGEQAVYALFGLGVGEFSFQTGVPSPDHTITVDPTNLVMEAARLLDESNRDEAQTTLDLGDMGDDWFEEATQAPEPAQLKNQIKDLLTRRFGRKARRLLQAVDRCEDSIQELEELSARVEKYVRVFLDPQAAPAVAREIRALLSGSSSSS